MPADGQSFPAYAPGRRPGPSSPAHHNRSSEATQAPFRPHSILSHNKVSRADDKQNGILHSPSGAAKNTAADQSASPVSMVQILSCVALLP